MKTIFRPIMLLIVLMVSGYQVHGQYYTQGQDPSSLRWKQIKTLHFQIIFPEEYAEQAVYIANVLEYAYKHGGKTLGHQPRRVPVVIHNQTVVSNGFVSWAPRRLEMFNTPPQNNGGHDWMESLAVHEFRHVVQVDKLNQGITKILAYLFGEHATGAALGIFVPLWFLEGDAVSTETALTYGGRGRMPDFEQGLRAQVLQKGPYSFDKATMGSFKDFVPNHYELGYQLVAAARKQYGADIWDKVLDNVALKPYTFFPFTFGLRKHTGMTKAKLFNQTMIMLDSAWTAQKDQHEYTPSQPVGPSKRIFTNYRYPATVNDSTFMAYKTGMGDIPRVVAIDARGQESIIFTPGIVNSYAFSTNGHYIVWSEQRTDPRWSHRSWSEIQRYDLKTGEKGRLTKNTRYFSPAISPDGSMIAVAEADALNQYSIVVISAESGVFIRRYNTTDNDFLMTPFWHENNKTLGAVALDESGKRIVVTDKELGGFTTIFHAGRTEISRPRFFSHDTIWFTGAFSGIDNIYALDVTSGEIKQIVSSPFGAVDVNKSPDGKSLYYAEYSSLGYGISSTPMSKTGISIGEVQDHSVKFHEVLTSQEDAIVTRKNIPMQEYLAIPYHKAGNLFRFHSWGPFVVDVDNMDGNPGFSVMSQNILSTSLATAGYDYDLNENLGKFFINYRYGGFYPKIDIITENGLRRSFYQSNNKSVPFLWRERTTKLGINVPLTFQHGAWFSGLTPYFRAGITRVLPTNDSPSFFRRNDISSLEYRLIAYRQYRIVARDIRPRWGQIIDLNYRHTPFKGGDMGSLFASRLVLYTPGLLPHHSLRMGAAYQQKETGERRQQTLNFSFSNLVMYPRGIEGRYNDKQIAAFTADYSFPLFYPDWTIPGILFIKRFSANVFYDYAGVTFIQTTVGESQQQMKQNLYATGIDLMTQIHLFRFLFPLNIGVRMSTYTDEEKWQFRLLGSIGI